jgi:hypothetical protein
MRNLTLEVDTHLRRIWNKIGIDRPANHNQIVAFCASDVQETADPADWHSGDIEIAFRRFIELNSDNEGDRDDNPALTDLTRYPTF